MNKAPFLMVHFQISEIFSSIQGEGPFCGMPTTFIRLVGCPLRCRWCDTEYAFTGGQRMSLEQVLSIVDELDNPSVCVTGGEPLAHKNAPQLLAALVEAFPNAAIELETSGALPTAGLPRSIVRVVDWKAPSSEEGDSFDVSILDDLSSQDALKFVVTEQDYEWLSDIFSRYGLANHAARRYIHPVAGELLLADLANWMLATRIPAQLGVQMHKIIWPGKDRGY